MSCPLIAACVSLTDDYETVSRSPNHGKYISTFIARFIVYIGICCHNCLNFEKSPVLENIMSKLIKILRFKVKHKFMDNNIY